MANLSHRLVDRDAGATPPAGAPLAIVSGAAAGIGLATLRRFVGAGWDCAALDVDAAALGRARDEHGDRVHPIVADLLRDDDDLAGRLAALADRRGSVTLVNNVGGSRRGPVDVADLTWHDTADTLAFNLKPMLRLTQVALPAMRAAGKGRIVNVASVTGRTGMMAVAADYAAAKGAVIAWSRQLVGALAGDGILINTVCPGIIATERIERRWRGRAAAENAAVMSRIPLGRLGTPEEVAEVIHFLGSDSNTYMTGSVIDINGGLFTP